MLKITGKHLPSLGRQEYDTGHGKLSAHLDLREAQNVETLKGLVRGADIFSQGYRPGSFNQNGGATHAPGLDGQWQFAVPAGYKSDNLTNNEFGWKTEWLDHRLQFRLRETGGTDAEFPDEDHFTGTLGQRHPRRGSFLGS